MELITRLYHLVGFGIILQKPGVCYIVPVGNFHCRNIRQELGNYYPDPDPELARDQYEYDLVLTTETMLTRYFKNILPDGVLAQWLEAWTAVCTIGVRIPSRGEIGR